MAVTVNSDKDNNSAVISLGEMFSDNVQQQQHLSSAGSPPPPPAVNGATADDVAPHRVSVNRCGSPPTGRSVSFQCGQIHRSEVDSSRLLGRRQSASDSKDAHVPTSTAPVLAVTSYQGTEHHVDDDLRSIHCEMSTMTMCPSGSHVCKCLTSPSSSKLADVEGCQPATSNARHKSQLTSKVDVDEANPSQTVAPECCVIHVSSSS